ncbi:class I lanthipeptide [Aquimarina celericrescens]|uniref:Class I lanthipeptide n=1 Tax=Aquimarina celericrescens TaxID=1964542 RepID=A0ABW5B0M1_9FLAO|nr:class I lanthipeptide [Aquimarina celericrescens]
MKTKAKKLKLNKIAVARLTDEELTTIKGNGDGERSYPGDPICPGMLLIPHAL